MNVTSNSFVPCWIMADIVKLRGDIMWNFVTLKYIEKHYIRKVSKMSFSLSFIIKATSSREKRKKKKKKRKLIKNKYFK